MTKILWTSLQKTEILKNDSQTRQMNSTQTMKTLDLGFKEFIFHHNQRLI